MKKQALAVAKKALFKQAKKIFKGATFDTEINLEVDAELDGIPEIPMFDGKEDE